MSVAFDEAWVISKNESKGKFRGYSKNTVSGRAERAGKARAWNQSRKVKRGRTRLRYSRNKKRGNVRPKMRRQLGAGGSRAEVSKDAADINAMVDAAAINELVEKASEGQARVVSLGGISPSSPLYQLSQTMGATDILQERPGRYMELFAGEGGDPASTGGFGVDPARRGSIHLTSDLGAYGYNPTWTQDIMDDSPQEWAKKIMAKLGNKTPDVLFASPTCLDMSTQNVGTKWNPPVGYGKAMKREAMEARKIGEAPSWMGESTDKNPFGNWEPVYPGQTTREGKPGSNKNTARLFKRTWDIAEELLRHNPDMFVMIENPLGMARYMPFTYSQALPDMATINMASYTDPASSIFGIADNVNPFTGMGIDPLSSNLAYASQSPEERRARAFLGDILTKPEKRTDIFGRFPPEWEPRPRIGQMPKDPTGKDARELIESGILFSDISQDPLFRGRAPIAPSFVQGLLDEGKTLAGGGFREWSDRQKKINAAQKQPKQRVLESFQVTGDPSAKILTGKSPFSGVLYPYAPAGSERGVNQTRGYKRFLPLTGEIADIPPYQARSVIPDELGADFSRAAERALGLIPPNIPETEYHMTDPNQKIREFLESGGINTKRKFRTVAGDNVTDWLESQGFF